jgi:hypothetical protein
MADSVEVPSAPRGTSTLAQATIAYAHPIAETGGRDAGGSVVVSAGILPRLTGTSKMGIGLTLREDVIRPGESRSAHAGLQATLFAPLLPAGLRIPVLWSFEVQPGVAQDRNAGPEPSVLAGAGFTGVGLLPFGVGLHGTAEVNPTDPSKAVLYALLTFSVGR